MYFLSSPFRCFASPVSALPCFSVALHRYLCPRRALRCHLTALLTDAISIRNHASPRQFASILGVSGAYTVYSMPSLCVTLLCNAIALRHVSMLFRRISKLCHSIAYRFASVHCDAAAVQPLHSHPRLDGSLPVLSMAAPCLPFPLQSQLHNSVSERVCAYPSLNTPSSRR